MIASWYAIKFREPFSGYSKRMELRVGEDYVFSLPMWLVFLVEPTIQVNAIMQDS
jgi:hypothetical protein